MAGSKLKYIKFKNFRNFGDEPVTISFDSKINLFIGKNNTGKSNILRFLDILSCISDAKDFNFNVPYQQSKPLNFPFIRENYHDFNKEIPIEFEIHFEPSVNYRKRILSSKEIDFYIAYEIQNNSDQPQLVHKSNFFNNFDNLDLNKQLEMFSVENTKPNAEPESKDDVITLLSFQYFITNEIQACFPKVEYVSEVRAINGEIIKNIHLLVQPDAWTQKNKVKRDILYSYFEVLFGYTVKINTFYYDNSKPENARIELEIEDKQYPLNMLGSGIEQIVLLAFNIIMTNAKIICIDEPEIHLHAAAQRAFLNMIAKVEDKQFFFATHSNNFLDYEVADKQVFQVTRNGKQTEILKATQLQNLCNIFDDLGQAKFIKQMASFG